MQSTFVRRWARRLRWAFGALVIAAVLATVALTRPPKTAPAVRVPPSDQFSAPVPTGARPPTEPGSSSFFGLVIDEGHRPLAGALVSVTDAPGDRTETVYTGADGSYAIRTAFKGPVKLRARHPDLADAAQTAEAPEGGALRVSFVMAKHADAQSRSDSLTASAHLTRVRWPDDAARATFVSQCHYCHQIGNAFTRIPKALEGWQATVTRMQGYGALLTYAEERTIVTELQRAMTGQPLEHSQHHVSDDALSRAKVYEWRVGDAMSFVHDADVGEDGRLYGTDQGHDVVWVLDRRTGAIEIHPQPDIALPMGGKFVALQLPIGVFTGKHGPHSLAQGPDGLFWITNALSSTLSSFDPRSGRFASYGFEESVLYPHTVRVDGEGVVWFTAAVSNKVVRFDPRTREATVIQLPHDGIGRLIGDLITPWALDYLGERYPRENRPVTQSPHRWTGGRKFANLPYGIDVNPKDGSVWYAKLYADRIGRIDPRTFEIEEYTTPLRGPRRMRFDRDGILWIPAFEDSALMRFDPQSGRFEHFPLPVLARGEYEAPYALNVHPKTGQVWITSNMSDRVLRFDPRSRTFTAYPCPTRVTYLRDMVFTKEGHVCSSSANLPAYAIEGGRGSFVCIDPEGGATDRQALSQAMLAPEEASAQPPVPP